MENDRSAQFMIAGMIIICVFAVALIYTQGTTINELEANITKYQSELENLQTSFSELSTSMEELHNTLETTDHNISELTTSLRVLTQEKNMLEKEIEIIDQALDIIGRSEVRTVLIALGNKNVELENLQNEYDELLKKYNAATENP